MGIEGLEGLDGLVRATGLHVARVMGVLWFLPIFAQGSAARFQKIGLSMVIGILVATARTEHLEDPGSDPLLLALATVRELLFGLVFGWMASLVFEAARIAGALIATEMGLNMSNQVDPISGLSQPLLSQLFISLVAILFFMSGGHELVIASLVQSFDTVKPGTFMLGPEMFEPLLGFTLAMIGAGVRMPAPVFVLLIVVTVCVGYLAKVAPQLHVLEASWPIRIAAGLILMILFLPEMLATFDGALELMGVNLQAMAAGR